MTDLPGTLPLAKIEDFARERLGWKIPQSRLPELRRWVERELKQHSGRVSIDHASRLAEGRLSDDELRRLIDTLAIGETYFFRDKNFFRVLEKTILPGLILERMNSGKSISIWSAGCSSGEEAYSLAIVLHELLPDPAGWRLRILASDIKEEGLETAASGIYRKHSFRTVSPEAREKHFTDMGDDCWKVPDEIRSLVNFSRLNLLQDEFPKDLDLIVCRNVLMYFTQEAAKRILLRFAGSLSSQGWLILSPSESILLHGLPFIPVVEDGALLYRVQPDTRRPQLGTAPLSARREQRPLPVRDSERPAADAGEKARDSADRGELETSLRLCRQVLSAGGRNASNYYLLASILDMKGEFGSAAEALENALEIDPGHIMSRLTGGIIARKLGRSAAASRQLRTALGLLSRLDPLDSVPEADGMSARQLCEFVEAVLHGGV